jgi:hypothetical protein
MSLSHFLSSSAMGAFGKPPAASSKEPLPVTGTASCTSQKTPC